MKPKFIPLTLLLFSAVASSEQVTMKCTDDDVYRHTTEVEKSFFSRSETTYRVEERSSGQWKDWCETIRIKEVISCEIFPDGASLRMYGITVTESDRKKDGKSILEIQADPLTTVDTVLDFVLFTKSERKEKRNENDDSVRLKSPVTTKCQKVL